jgi:hypothetical protein
VLGGYSNAELALMISGAALLYAVIRWRRNTVTKKPSMSSMGPEKVVMSSALNMREINMEVQALLSDLEETCRRLTAQLDNRYQRLEMLLSEADEKIRKLEGITGAPAGRVPEKLPPASAATAAAHEALVRLRKERGAPAAGEDPAYQPIYTLADGGKNSREIAQQLGRQPGEIELILALRQRAVEH